LRLKNDLSRQLTGAAQKGSIMPRRERMQQFILGWAITMIAALTPTLALAEGRGVAQQVADALRESGTLKDYNINVKYQGGTAWLQGQVKSPQQMGQALAIAKGVPGVQRVVNEMSVNASRPLTIKPAEQAPRAFQLASETKSLFAESGDKESEPSLTTPPAAEPELTSAERPARPIITEPRPVVAAVVGRAIDQSEHPANVLISGELPRHDPSGIPSHNISTRNRATRPMEPAALSDAREGVVPAIPQFAANHGAAPLAQPAVLNRSAMDQQTAQQVASQFRSGGRLKNYRIGVTVQDGTARLNGTVANKQQMAQAVFIAKQTRGINNVVNELSLAPAGQPAPVQKAGYDPAVPGYHSTGMEGVPPESMGPHYADAGPMGGAPVPAYGFGVAGAAPAHYDEPHMPNHAWPSYAAYPNYGAVTYPRQYSPTAWPYIGPFYPYPQVPLGWRKVTLEWDDGWWFLDFDDRNW